MLNGDPATRCRAGAAPYPADRLGSRCRTRAQPPRCAAAHRVFGGAAFRQTRSLISVIELLNGLGYLQPLKPEKGPSEPMPGTAVLDPAAPLSLGRISE
jgi:hypothetical protein